MLATLLSDATNFYDLEVEWSKNGKNCIMRHPVCCKGA